MVLQRTDLQSGMEVGEAPCQQDRLQLLSEKRKWQTEMENKKRQLEDDRRALQHLKSKALRERWLLDGAPSAGPEQDHVTRQLEQDQAKTRSLEETITRLEEELLNLQTGGRGHPTTHSTVSSGSVEAVEVKGPGSRQQDAAAASGHIVGEVKVQKSPGKKKPREAVEEMKRAVYSVEIKVERDRVTGETRVVSTNTTLPVDLSHQGVKVYEDEQKVVHEMNGENGLQLLSYSEVEELIHKADEASMMSQTVTTVTSLATVEVQDEAGQKPPAVPVEITGLEAKADIKPNVAEASAEEPITMVFMGYQSVEDEDETKKVLGLQGTVKAELVLIDDTDSQTSPGEGKQEAKGAQTAALPPSTSTAPPSSPRPPQAEVASNGETAVEMEQLKGGVVEIKKKQPCKCCSIM